VQQQVQIDCKALVARLFVLIGIVELGLCLGAPMDKHMPAYVLRVSIELEGDKAGD
jgi:hypothetical protein